MMEDKSKSHPEEYLNLLTLITVFIGCLSICLILIINKLRLGNVETENKTDNAKPELEPIGGNVSIVPAKEDALTGKDDPSGVTDEVSVNSEMNSNEEQNNLFTTDCKLTGDCKISSDEEHSFSGDVSSRESMPSVCQSHFESKMNDDEQRPSRLRKDDSQMPQIIGPLLVPTGTIYTAKEETGTSRRSSRLMRMKKQFKGTFAKSVAQIHKMYLKIEDANQEELEEYRRKLREDEKSTPPATGTFSNMSTQDSPLKFVTPVSSPSELKNLDFTKESDEIGDYKADERDKNNSNDSLNHDDCKGQLIPIEKFSIDKNSKEQNLVIENIYFGDEEKSFFCDLKELENLTGEKIILEEEEYDDDHDDDDDANVDDDEENTNDETVYDDQDETNGIDGVKGDNKSSEAFDSNEVDYNNNTTTREAKIEELRQITNAYLKNQGDTISSKEIWYGKVDDSTDGKISVDNDLWEKQASPED